MTSAVLDEIVTRGDPAALEEMRYRAQHKGQAPPRQTLDSPANNYGSPAASYNAYNMSPAAARGNAMATQIRLPTGRSCPRPSSTNCGCHLADDRVGFKSSPFYEISETVVPLTNLPGTVGLSSMMTALLT